MSPIVIDLCKLPFIREGHMNKFINIVGGTGYLNIYILEK